MSKSPLIFPILFIGVAASFLLVVGGLTVFAQSLNKCVFEKKQITTEKDKAALVRTLGLWLSIYLFGLASAVMTLRILTGKATPASNNDGLLISTLNRIITNTIEQSIIFAGLYGILLFSEVDHLAQIGGVKILALASLFVIGRVIYAIGYILGSVTKISSCRSFGFAIGLSINIILVAYHLGFDPFHLLDTHAAPVIKGYLN